MEYQEIIRKDELRQRLEAKALDELRQRLVGTGRKDHD